MAHLVKTFDPQAGPFFLIGSLGLDPARQLMIKRMGLRALKERSLRTGGQIDADAQDPDGDKACFEVDPLTRPA